MISTLEITNGHSCGASYLADPDFAMEEPGARAQVERWWPHMQFIAEAANKEAARAAVCRQTGEKEGNVRKLYYAWKNAGRDWGELIDRREFPDPRTAVLPPFFEQFIRKIHGGLSRDQAGTETHRLIMERLAAWELDPLNPDLAIPGYDEPPHRNPLRGHPDGWSLRSFRRRLPDKYQRTLRKQGPKSASEFLPSNYSTRVGLDIGQIIYFDDQWHDNSVNFTGVNNRALRPQSFNALDGLTGFAFEPGLKPQIWDEEKSKRIELTQEDFFWYVMSVLTRDGYNAQTGTTLIMEHGTANVDKRDRYQKDGSRLPEHFDWRIEEITGGKVKIDRSGIWRAPAFKQMLFEGKPTGNFRFKAPIESYFNLVRNRTMGLPAPTGRNPERAPEENHGLIAYNNQLLKLIDDLPRDRFLRLQRPVLEWEDYTAIYRGIHRAINRRSDHHLEGWRKLGFTGQRYRLGLDLPWMTEEAYQLIPADKRAALDHIVSQPGYFESFLLSPEAAFDSRRDRLTRLPMHTIPLLAPARMWKDVTVSDNLEMRILANEIDSEPLRFFATRVRTPQGHEVTLQRGRTYLRLLNIFAPDQLWIAEKDGPRPGALVGTATRILPPCKADAAALQSALGEHAHIRSVESKEVVVRMEGEAAQRMAMREHNLEVIGGNTPEDRANRAEAARGAVPLETFVHHSDPEAGGPAPLTLEDFLPKN